MPTYEYVCRSCGNHLEVVQTFDDEPLTECPSCEGPLRKVFGAIGVVLKGSGFYKTDNRAASGKKSASGSGDGSKSDTKTDSKGDSKGDSKSESKSDTPSSTATKTA